MSENIIDIDSLLSGSSGKNMSGENQNVVDIDTLLGGGQGIPSEPKKPDFNWGRFLGEQFSKGVFSVADFGEMIGTLGGLIGKEQKPISERTKQALKKTYNLDLDSQGEGNTAAQKIVGKAANFAGGSVIPGGGLLKGMAGAATIGAAAGGLNELGLPEPIADLTAIAGGIATPGAVNKIKNRKLALSSQEEKVAKNLEGFIGEAEKRNVINNLDNTPSHTAISDYQPMTAEVANNPSIAQMHRAREGIPGSGIADAASQQNKAIMSKFDEHSFKASTSNDIKSEINERLVKSKEARRNATQSGYQSVDNMNDIIKPEQLLNYINAKPMAGTIKKDLTSIIKDLGSKEGTKISQLAAIDADLTAKIEKYANSGQNKRATILKQAQEALRKDLDVIDTYKEARTKYAELSKPVNDILKHPTLKNIPESRANNLMGQLYNKNSTDNLTQLKKVLGDDVSTWEGIQHATTDYLKKKIMNSGAQGNSHVLSYDKLNHFLQEHGKALEKVYDKPQMEFVNTLNEILAGQNKAKTLGKFGGSDTQAKQAIDEMLKEGLGIKGLRKASKATSYIPLLGGNMSHGLLSGLEWYSKNNQSKLLSILDRALIEPEYAKKLLTSKFKTKRDFFDFVNSFPKGAAISASFKNEKEKD